MNSNKLFIAISVVLFLLLTFWAYCFFTSKINNSKSGVAKTTVQKDSVITLRYDSAAITFNDGNLSHKTETIFYPKYKNIIVDTGAIINNWLSCNTSVYNYWKDSLYNLVITDSICRGKLLKRDIAFKSLKPDSIITYTTTITNYEALPQKGKLYLGNQSTRNNILTPSIMYSNKRYAFNAGYGVTTKDISLGFYLLIY